KVVVDENFPPFVQMAQGSPAGLGIEVLQAAADRAGIELRFVPVPFVRIQPTVDEGKADAIFPLAINPDRLKLYDFSEPLVSTGGALFVRAPSPTPESLQALSGKSLITPKTGPLANYIQRNAPEVQLSTTADYDETLEQLVAGKADAAALNLQVGSRFVADNYAGRVTVPDRYFWELPLAVAVPKASPNLKAVLGQLNEGIRAIRGDGTWAAIVKRYEVR
ncbi:MAG: substrate-binding periplasmic protein, partial [Pigmentiphaga sp.]